MNMKAWEDLPPPSHHPAEEYLFDYALGTLPEAWSLAVATHLTFCPECRARVASYEAMAGSAMAAAEDMAVAPDSLDRVLARLEAAEDPPQPARQPGAVRVDGIRLPAPLAPYLAGSETELPPWRRVMSGLDEIRLPLGDGGRKAVLLRIQPGRAMPAHTHRGDEMTVVLDGGFTDSSGAFRRGDCALLDAQVDHRPVAMADRACLCLAVTDAPLKLTGPIGRWLNPLFRY
jgi:putative transcriptional regulator